MKNILNKYMFRSTVFLTFTLALLTVSFFAGVKDAHAEIGTLRVESNLPTIFTAQGSQGYYSTYNTATNRESYSWNVDVNNVAPGDDGATIYTVTVSEKEGYEATFVNYSANGATGWPPLEPNQVYVIPTDWCYDHASDDFESCSDFESVVTVTYVPVNEADIIIENSCPSGTWTLNPGNLSGSGSGETYTVTPGGGTTYTLSFVPPSNSSQLIIRNKVNDSSLYTGASVYVRRGDTATFYIECLTETLDEWAEITNIRPANQTIARGASLSVEADFDWYGADYRRSFEIVVTKPNGSTQKLVDWVNTYPSASVGDPGYRYAGNYIFSDVGTYTIRYHGLAKSSENSFGSEPDYYRNVQVCDGECEPGEAFRLSLSNGGTKTAVAGESIHIPQDITAKMESGDTPEPVQLFNVSNTHGMIIQFPQVCTPNPTCPLDVILKLDGTMPVGTYPLTFVGKSTLNDSVRATTTFNLIIVDIPPPGEGVDLSAGATEPTAVTVGQSVTFTSAVYNNGNTAAGAFSSSFEKYTGPNRTGVGTELSATPRIQSLVAGGQSSIQSSATSFATAGTYYVRACADTGAEVTEYNEDNNCGSWATVTVTEPPQPPGTATLRVSSNLATTWTIDCVTIPPGECPTLSQGIATTSVTYIIPIASGVSHGYSITGASKSGYDLTISNSNGGGSGITLSAGDFEEYYLEYTGGPDFNYHLGNSGDSRAEKRSNTVYTQNTITVTKDSGTARLVELSAAGLPNNVTATFANNPCTPTPTDCRSTITFAIDPGSPVGTHPITVTGMPNSKTTTFDLIITAAPMTVDCVPSPAITIVGRPVSWDARITGGTSPFTLRWFGTDIPTSPAPSADPYVITYTTLGTKTAAVSVTDSSATPITASCTASTVQVNFNPEFEEF